MGKDGQRGDQDAVKQCIQGCQAPCTLAARNTRPAGREGAHQRKHPVFVKLVHASRQLRAFKTVVAAP